MGKSSKKTNVQAAPAVSAVSGKPGKRGAEKVLDKVVIAKKQKKETKEDTLEAADKPKTPTVQNPTSGSQTLYVGNLSYDVGQDDLSEFFKGAGEVVGVHLATRRNGNSKGFAHVDFATEEDVKKALELNGKDFFGRALKLLVSRKRDSNTPQSGNEKGSKDQSHTIFVKGFDKSLGQNQEPAKTASAPAKSGAFAGKNGSVGAVTRRGEESSSSESDSDEDKEDILEAAEKHTAPDTNLEKKQESCPSESHADEDDAFEDSSNSEESSEKSSDEESEDAEPSEIPKTNKDVKMKDATIDSAQKQTKKSEKKVPKTPTVQNTTSGSQTLYVGNLSYDVSQHDLSEFFKGAGEVVGVRLATRGKGSSKGFGHVDFATEEDVKKALELNGQEFFGRELKLEVALERDSNTPRSGNEKGGKDQSHTIFVKGFDKSLGQDQIKNSLQKHFGSCGDISRISILKDHESGALKGMAFVDFKDQNAYKKAFELNGSELGGRTLTIDEGKPKGDNSNGRGKGGGKFSGRGGGRGGRGDRGRGRGSSGRGRGRGGGRGGRGDRSIGRSSGGRGRGRGGAGRNSSDG